MIQSQSRYKTVFLPSVSTDGPQDIDQLPPNGLPSARSVHAAYAAFTPDYDTEAIVQAFRRWVECGSGESEIHAAHSVSPAGMAILWAGLSKDLSLLQEPCVVVKVNYEAHSIT